jgi:hypothetical protein
MFTNTNAKVCLSYNTNENVECFVSVSIQNAEWHIPWIQNKVNRCGSNKMNSLQQNMCIVPTTDYIWNMVSTQTTALRVLGPGWQSAVWRKQKTHKIISISGNERERERTGVTVRFPVRISAVLQPIVVKRLLALLALTMPLSHDSILRFLTVTMFSSHLTLYIIIRTFNNH